MENLHYHYHIHIDNTPRVSYKQLKDLQEKGKKVEMTTDEKIRWYKRVKQLRDQKMKKLENQGKSKLTDGFWQEQEPTTFDRTEIKYHTEYLIHATS